MIKHIQIIEPVYADSHTKQLPSLVDLVPGFINPTQNPGSALSSVLAAVIALVYIIGGFTAFFVLVQGAYALMTSGGDQQKLTAGRSRITWGLVGLVILLASWFLIVLAEQLTGICFGFSCPFDLGEISPV